MNPPDETWEVMLSEPKIKELWTKIKDFDKLFSDECTGDIESFVHGIMDPNTTVLECDYGILVLSDIVKGSRAEAHLTFWDKKLSAHTVLVQECLVWAFLNFDLNRITVKSPAYARFVHNFLYTKLGFHHEGTLRQYIKKDGVFVDMLVFGLLRKEALNAATRNLRGHPRFDPDEYRRHVLRTNSLQRHPKVSRRGKSAESDRSDRSCA